MKRYTVKKGDEKFLHIEFDVDPYEANLELASQIRDACEEMKALAEQAKPEQVLHRAKVIADKMIREQGPLGWKVIDGLQIIIALDPREDIPYEALSMGDVKARFIVPRGRLSDRLVTPFRSNTLVFS